MPCIKKVVNSNCPYCQSVAIKYGKIDHRQRYRCKACKRIFMDNYINQACYSTVNKNIIDHVKEGCGIRSIARLLRISSNTVMRRIRNLAKAVEKPVLTPGATYEVDEIRTYVKNKVNAFWIIYALDKQSGKVTALHVGKRTKENVKKVTDPLLKADCEKIYTDRLNLYKLVIPTQIHTQKRFGTNRIERMNLTLRTHLKRLNRRTICFSKCALMLEACLAIYFWT